ALLLVRPEAVQAGYIKNRLQLHTVARSAGRPGLHARPAQAELQGVCGAVHQDAAGRGTLQEEE
ncbi:hypothetical protein M9458_029282, partial [Cirrhinus mrigala]